MRDQAVRIEVGHTIRRAARFARVSRQTIERYERDPDSVGLRRRARCYDYYRRLRLALDVLRAIKLAEPTPTRFDDSLVARLHAELRAIVDRELARAA